MSISISNNISSLNAQRSLGINQRSLSGNMAHLSSGMRINSAADDAAGMAIAEQMTSDISSYQQSQRNANDGVSMMQVASGAMNQQAQLLTRMKSLATEAANGTLGTAQLADTDTEFQQDINEVGRISSSTSYNGIAMLAASSTVTFQVGTGANGANDQISTTVGATDTTTLGVASLDLTTQANAQTALTAIDTAIQTLSTSQATVGAAQNRLTAASDNASAFAENLQSAESSIRDVDVASESAAMSRNSILVQAGTAVLAQANQLPNAALKLLQ
jgi:flagellin